MKAGLFRVQASLDKAKSGAIRVDELPNLQKVNVLHDYGCVKIYSTILNLFIIVFSI